MSRARGSGTSPVLIPLALAAAIVATGFATLMVRLEATQEGYRLSALHTETLKLEQENQRFKLERAELESHERLRALAARYGLGPPAPGRVIVVP